MRSKVVRLFIREAENSLIWYISIGLGKTGRELIRSRFAMVSREKEE